MTIVIKMQAKKLPHILFISDCHLDKHTPIQRTQFLDFLNNEAAKADALYILGDLFNLWLGDDHQAEWIIALKKALYDTAQKTPLYIMPGNRDFLLGSAFCQSVDATLLCDPTMVTLFGQQAVLCHGDALCTQDTKHQMMRRCFYHAQVVAGIFQVRAFEFRCIFYVTYFLKNILGIPINLHPLEEGLRMVAGTSYKHVQFHDVITVSVIAGSYIRYLLLAIGLSLSCILFFFHVGNLFKTSYSMKSLAEAEKVNWPHINGVLTRNLQKKDINKGPYAMALSPMLFAVKYDLLDKIVKDHKPGVKLRKGAAHRIFALQMGPLWVSLQVLPVYMKALFAIFAAKAEQNGKEANKLIFQIAESSGSQKINFSGYMPLLRKHVRSKVVGRACSPHAYVYTVMASMIEAARNDGVMATSEFIWLKGVDRRLWFMLNSVGRQTPFSESSGPFSHWKIEQKLRRPLKVPQIEGAVVALDLALEEILYNPDDYE